MGTSYSEFSGSAEARVTQTLSPSLGIQLFASNARQAALAEAFAFQLENQLKLEGKRVGWVGPGTLKQENHYIICRGPSLSTFAELPDIVKKIATKIETNSLFVRLPILSNSAHAKCQDVQVRVCSCYDITIDLVVTRFDVLVERVVEEWQGLGQAAAADKFEDFFEGLHWTPEQVEKMKTLRPLAIDGEAEKRKLEDQVFKPLSSPKAKAEAKTKDPIPLRALDFANKSARPFTSPDQYKFVPDSWK